MQEAAAEGLVDRLDDCRRKFPVAAVLNGAGTVFLPPRPHPALSHNAILFTGSVLSILQPTRTSIDFASRKNIFHGVLGATAGENVVRRLLGGRAGVQEVILMDTSRAMLDRAKRLEVKPAPSSTLPVCKAAMRSCCLGLGLSSCCTKKLPLLVAIDCS